MTASIPRDVAAQMLAAARASDGSPAALDAIAAEHGLMLPELKALIARADQPPKRSGVARTATTPTSPSPVATRTPLAAATGTGAAARGSQSPRSRARRNGT